MKNEINDEIKIETIPKGLSKKSLYRWMQAKAYPDVLLEDGMVITCRGQTFDDLPAASEMWEYRFNYELPGDESNAYFKKVFDLTR